MNVTPTSARANNLRSSRLHKQFKSPVLVNNENSSLEDTTTSLATSMNTDEGLLKTLNATKVNCAKLKENIDALNKQGIHEEELEEHIEKLHEYNEIKDATQVVLGQLANLERVTVAELHKRYNLDLKE